MAIEDALAPWLGNQRWFAGKGQGLRDLAIVSDTKLAAGDPELRHLIIAVSHGATVDYYQILVGLRRKLPERLEYARIGPVGEGPAGGGRIAYDALHDADLTKPLLAGIVRPRGPRPKHRTALDEHYIALRQELRRTFQTIGLAATGAMMHLRCRIIPKTT